MWSKISPTFYAILTFVTAIPTNTRPPAPHSLTPSVCDEPPQFHNNGSSYTATSICIQPNNIPMQSQTMQECWKPFHKNQDGYGKCCPHGEHDPQNNTSNPTFKHQPITQNHVPQHLRQLCNKRHTLQCWLQLSIMLEWSTSHFHIWENTHSITCLETCYNKWVSLTSCHSRQMLEQYLYS